MPALEGVVRQADADLAFQREGLASAHDPGAGRGVRALHLIRALARDAFDVLSWLAAVVIFTVAVKGLELLLRG